MAEPLSKTIVIDAADRRFALVPASDLLSHAEPVKCIVDGILEENVTCGVIAPPEGGKSLFALHLAACISTGQPFFGRSVTHGLVVYLCGEGYHGIARRLQAIESHHKLGLVNASLVVSKVGASFLSVTEVARIKAAIELAEERFGPMVLLVIDTLARFISPGDESKAQDMGAYLNAAEALRGNASAMTLHHPGHGDAQRGRGSSAWRGGVDAEFTLASANDVVTVTCAKMKDAEKPAPFSFRITPAPTKLCREDGSPVNSVVIVPTDTVVTKPKPTGKNQLRLLQELERRAEATYSVWSENELRDIAKALGMPRNRAQEAVLGLRSLAYLVNTVGGSYLPHIRPKCPKPSERTHSDGTCPSETSDDSLESDSSDVSAMDLPGNETNGELR